MPRWEETHSLKMPMRACPTPITGFPGEKWTCPYCGRCWESVGSMPVRAAWREVPRAES